MYKVLIIEDDPMVGMINEKYVKRNRQFEVVGVKRNGKSGLEFLETHEVDLVILDVFMPYMSGIEVLHAIREKNMSVDVIMVTAANDTATLEETMHLGVIDYLVKPFDYDRFQIALDKYASQTSAIKDVKVLNQQSVDFIIDNYHSKNTELAPKGIQEKTINIIMDYLSSEKDGWFTGDTIAENVGLSSVTVRRYMNHLIKTGAVVGNMNYETGGRPCMLYKLSSK